MSPTYLLKIVTDFAAAHALRGYPGDCQNLHGHNWKVEVEVRANRLNKIGIAIDFKKLKGMTQHIIDDLDHSSLNEIPPFDQTNPTAENIAAYIYHRLAEDLEKEFKHTTLAVAAITLWETGCSSVCYSETLETIP